MWLKNPTRGFVHFQLESMYTPASTMTSDDRGPEVLGVTWSFLVLTNLVTLLRIYCRAWELRCFWIGDWLAASAQVFFTVCLSSEIVSVKYGTGRHVQDIPPHDYPAAVRHWWTCDVTYIITNLCIKASIAVLLLRICQSRVHWWMVIVTISTTMLYGIFFLLLFILQCQPTSLYWRKFRHDPPEGRCLDPSVTSKGFYAYSAISCVTDWTFSLLPICMVWNLRLTYRDKVSVICILAAGMIASTATIVRLRYLYTLADIEDFLYTTTDVAIWSTIETGLAIIIAATATLRPLLRKWFGEDTADNRDDIPSPRQHPYQKAGSSWETYNDGLGLGGYSHRGIGVTTVIDHTNDGGKQDDAEARAHGEVNRIPGPSWVREYGEIRQSDLAPTVAIVEPAKPSRAWITVRRSLVQTTESES